MLRCRTFRNQASLAKKSKFTVLCPILIAKSVPHREEPSGYRIAGSRDSFLSQGRAPLAGA